MMWWRKKKPAETKLQQHPQESAFARPVLSQTTSPFSAEPWRRVGDEVNGISFGDTARAHGRYEVALAFHRIGTEWYRENVVNKPNRRDSRQMRAQFRECLQEYDARILEYGHLMATRARIVQELRAYPNGILRAELSKLVKHTGVTKFGVICNQISKGGWVRQEGTGTKTVVFSMPEMVESDLNFVARVIPKPGTSGMWAGFGE